MSPIEARSRNGRRTAVVHALVLAGILSCLPRHAGADTDSTAVDSALKVARVQLDSGSYDGARRAIQVALDPARTANESRSIARCESALGFAWERQWAAESESSAVRSQYADSAEAHYSLARRAVPDWVPATYNLGLLYWREGSPSKGQPLLKQAYQKPSSRWALHGVSYAACALDARDWGTAAQVAHTLLDSLPDLQQAHSILTEVCMRGDPAELDPYLWTLLDHGRLEQAQTLGARALLEPDLSDDVARKVLTAVAVAMARGYAAPAQLLTQTAADTLRNAATLGRDRGIALQQILGVLQENRSYDPGSYSWWARNDAVQSKFSHQTAPRDAFQQLLDRMGQWYQQHQDTLSASRCYSLAAGLVPNAVMPKAVADLADLYARSNQQARLDTLARQYGRVLVRPGGQAYKSKDLQSIYSFNRTLGIAYSRTGKVGGADSVGSAIYHLEQAQSAADQFNQQASHEGVKDTIVVEPKLVRLLATDYQVAGARAADPRLGQQKTNAGNQVLLKSADGYIKRGRLDAADTVLARGPITALGAKSARKDSITFMKLRARVAVARATK